MRIYYHNITQGHINSDWLEFLEIYKEGDTCYKSESGSALLIAITKEGLKKLKENYIKYLTENEWI